MSDLKLKKGDILRADRHWNPLVDRLPGQKQGSAISGSGKVVLCRVTEDIAPAEIDDADTADSVYYGGVVDTYGMIDNEDGTFSPAITSQQRIMLNPSPTETIPEDTELWAQEINGNYLVALVWPC